MTISKMVFLHGPSFSTHLFPFSFLSSNYKVLFNLAALLIVVARWSVMPQPNPHILTPQINVLMGKQMSQLFLTFKKWECIRSFPTFSIRLNDFLVEKGKRAKSCTFQEFTGFEKELQRVK